jgi:tetratricopeptide (TPR) repeat protein
MVLKWARGGDLPQLGSLKKLADALEQSNAISKDKVLSLRRWLVIARVLAHVEKEWPAARGAMLRHWQSGLPVVDIESMLSLAVFFSAKRYSSLVLPALTLYEDLKRLSPKQVGDQDRARRAIEDFERLRTEHDPDGNTVFHLEWMKGRFHALSGQHEQALFHYEQAMELGSYRAGPMLKQILEESLAIAGFLEKKPALKRLKNKAVAMQLLAAPKHELMEEWEITEFSRQFHRLFPAQGRFQETLPLEGKQVQPGFLMLGPEEINAIRPDMSHPDRIRAVHAGGGQVRYWPQLRFFASFGKSAEVAALLRHGASVDLLDKSGGSALLCAIQYATQKRDRKVLDLLLQQPHDRKTLDSATVKKKLTPLICAIEYGEPDVVERLLNMGATADRRGNINDNTPLYYVMGTLAALTYPDKLERYLRNSVSVAPDLMRQEVFRRHSVGFAGVMGDGSVLKTIGANERHKQLLDIAMALVAKQHVAEHTVAKLIRITELLLMHGADPNAGHDYPVRGRTPLMLAAENDSVEAFDLMLRYGGDADQRDGSGHSSVEIATGFRAARVVTYLRDKRIR